MWDSEKIAAISDGELLGNSTVPCSGWSIDSRKVSKGQVFAAFRGENTDGHSYIQKALAAGAAVILAESSRLQELEIGISDVPAGKAIIGVKDCLRAMQELAKAWRTELNPLVVGITGSNGKTTTKDMVAAVLSAKYRVHKNTENQNNEIGLPLTILNAPPGVEIMVLEMGMRGLGQIKALCDICRPSLGLITNIGPTHLELLETQENIGRAKWELIDCLPQDGIAVLNAEDYQSVTKAAAAAVKKVFYGIKGEYIKPDVQGTNIRAAGELKTIFEAIAGGQKAAVNLPLQGEHNVLDALAALAVGLNLGISLKEGAHSLMGLQLSKMRLEILPGILDSVILNDVYNANPISMQASLKVLAERGGDKTIAVLGEMYELGDAAVSGHREVGQTAALLGIRELVTVGDLARGIALGARENDFAPQRIHHCDDCDQASSVVLQLLKEYGSGTWILVKGSRGMKMERVSRQITK